MGHRGGTRAVGGAASTMRSARCARSSRLVEAAAEARTIRTLAGSRWMNKPRTNELSVAAALSPSSCCILRKSCEGLRSPSSSEWRSCCRRRWSDAAVRLTSCSRRESYGRVSGGCSIRSRTSVAYSGESDATMYSNFVLCAVI